MTGQLIGQQMACDLAVRQLSVLMQQMKSRSSLPSYRGLR